VDKQNFYLFLSAALFSIGVLGILIRKNTLVLFMCVELMLNAVNLTLVSFSERFGSVTPQVYVFFVMAVAAAEAAVGLGIILVLFRNFYSVQSNDAASLRG